jgi:hypothetical protein
MWRTQPAGDYFNLETRAAGLALACNFSGSDEYEASIIARRREAGAYRRPHRQLMMTAAAALAGLLFVMTF